MTAKESLIKDIQQQIDNNPQLSQMWVYLECEIQWKDTPNETEGAIIRVVPEGIDTEELDTDDEVTYYIYNINDLLDLCNENNGSDFIVVDYYYSFMQF